MTKFIVRRTSEWDNEKPCENGQKELLTWLDRRNAKTLIKIGFNIKIDSNICDLHSQYEKEDLPCAIECCGEISYILESAGIWFPLSEESRRQ